MELPNKLENLYIFANKTNEKGEIYGKASYHFRHDIIHAYQSKCKQFKKTGKHRSISKWAAHHYCTGRISN